MGDLANFAVGVHRRDDCAVVRVEGELDMANAPEFEAVLAPVISASHVVIDLSACTFLDSAGMGVIAATALQAPRVSLVATNPGVLRVLEITAVDTMVPVHASLDDVL